MERAFLNIRVLDCFPVVTGFRVLNLFFIHCCLLFFRRNCFDHAVVCCLRLMIFDCPLSLNPLFALTRTLSRPHIGVK